MGFAAEKPEPWTHIDIFKVFKGIKTLNFIDVGLPLFPTPPGRKKISLQPACGMQYGMRLDAGDARRHYVVFFWCGMHF